MCKRGCQMHVLLPIPTNWFIYCWQTSKHWCCSCPYIPIHLRRTRMKTTKKIILDKDRINSYLQYVIMSPFHWYEQTHVWIYLCIDKSTSFLYSNCSVECMLLWMDPTFGSSLGWLLPVLSFRANSALFLTPSLIYRAPPPNKSCLEKRETGQKLSVSGPRLSRDHSHPLFG